MLIFRKINIEERRAMFKKTFNSSPKTEGLFVPKRKNRRKQKIKCNVNYPVRCSERLKMVKKQPNYKELNTVKRKQGVNLHHTVKLNQAVSTNQAATMSKSVTSIRKPFKCDDCSASYAFKNSLSKHISSVHSGTSFSCNICAKTFSVQASVKRHKDAVHRESEKRFVCEKCGKTFGYKGNLSKHHRLYHG